jgi:hypothetical protein
MTNIKTILAITRALIGLATSLHLTSLKGAIFQSERAVARAFRRADAAVVARTRAAALAAAARVVATEQTVAAKLAGKAHNQFVSAAVAEADTLSTNHNVG